MSITKTATTLKFRPLIKTYLLEAIADEDHGLENPTEKDLFKHVSDRVNSEYGFMVQHVGLQNTIREWLLGLALSVDYTYCDIEKRLNEWGILNENSKDGKINKELDQYWTRLAGVLTQEIQKL